MAEGKSRQPGWRTVEPALRRAMAPVLWALWRQGAVGTGAGALAAAAAWCLAVIGISRVLPVPAAELVAAAGAAAAGVVAAGLLLRRPGPREVAVAGDRAGLRERLITALELGADTSLLGRAQREDAMRALHAGDWRPHLGLRWPRRRLWAAVLLGAAAGTVFLLPDRGAQLGRLRARVQTEAARQADLVARAAASLAPPGGAVMDPTRAQAAKALRKLEDQLRQTGGGQEAMVDLTEATREMEKLVDAPRVRQGRALLELGSALASTERARQAGESLARRDWQGAGRGLEALASQLENAAREGQPPEGQEGQGGQGEPQGGQNQAGQQGRQDGDRRDAAGARGQALSRAEQEALANLLAQAARNAGLDTPLGQALQQAARELMAGRPGAAAEALRELARMAAEAGRALDSQEALAAALRQLQGAQAALAAAQNPQQAAGQRGQQAAGQLRLPGAGAGGIPPLRLPGPGEGAGAGQGEGQGQGQGEGEGEGMGEGSGQGFGTLRSIGLLLGGGAGEGEGLGLGLGQGDGPGGPQGGGEPGRGTSDRVSAGGLAPGPQQSRTGEPPRDYRQFEPIWAPSRLGGEGTPDYLTGALGEGAGQAVETESSPVGAPALRPYSQVYAEYQQQAREGLERAELPATLQDSVKRYFSNLAPGSDGSAR